MGSLRKPLLRGAGAGGNDMECVYTVFIRTGSIWKAGTDSNITLMLAAADDNGMGITDLPSRGGQMGPGHSYFERGNLDIFSGRGRRAGCVWPPTGRALVTITDPHKGCAQELSTNTPPYKLEVVVDHCSTAPPPASCACRPRLRVPPRRVGREVDTRCSVRRRGQSDRPSLSSPPASPPTSPWSASEGLRRHPWPRFDPAHPWPAPPLPPTPAPHPDPPTAMHPTSILLRRMTAPAATPSSSPMRDLGRVEQRRDVLLRAGAEDGAATTDGPRGCGFRLAGRPSGEQGSWAADDFRLRWTRRGRWLARGGAGGGRRCNGAHHVRRGKWGELHAGTGRVVPPADPRGVDVALREFLLVEKPGTSY